MSQEADSIIAPKKKRVKVPMPPQAHLKVCLDYNPETGVFTWLPRPLNHFATQNAHATYHGRDCGNEAGCVSTHIYNGRQTRVIRILGHTHAAHRLAWIWMHGDGSIPEDLEIDHKNRDPLDNRIENLRIATHQQNSYNQNARRTAHGKPRTLPKGVRINRQGRYVARIVVEKVKLHIGTYDTPEEAAEAYQRRSKELHGEFGNPS